MASAIICSFFVAEASAAMFFPTGLARVNRFHAAHGKQIRRQDSSNELLSGQDQSELTAVSPAQAIRPALGSTVELAQPAYTAGEGIVSHMLLSHHKTARAFLTSTNGRNNVVSVISAATADAQDSSDALMEAAISSSIKSLESNVAQQQRTGLLRRFMLATASTKATATATAASSKGPAAMALPVDESGFVASEDDWFQN
jgi:hypothetical protein